MANKNISGDVNVEFTEAQSRQSLESGESVKTLFGKLRKWLTDLKPVAFSGSYNDLSDKPTIPSSAVTGVKGNSESNYRTGNVNITKSNIGLSSVENKSSATIRSEITWSDVTDGLEYIPVNKAGDTMDGSLTFKDPNSNDGGIIDASYDDYFVIEAGTDKIIVLDGPTLVGDYLQLDNVNRPSTSDNDRCQALGFVVGSDDSDRIGRVVNLYKSDIVTSASVISALGYTPVSGVKGDTETDYRTGNVNITAANIGAVRYDTSSQGLTSTQKSNARTNLGLGTAATYSSSSFATSTQGGYATDFNSNFKPIFATSGQSHASVFRGKYLGSSFTSTQKTAILNGTFDDLYIGDYWTINGINWRIADIDYFLNSGSTNTTTHHLVIVPDTGLGTGYMNSSSTTSGGYYGSYMKTTLLKTTSLSSTDVFYKVTQAFGSDYILQHYERFVNAVSTSTPYGPSGYSSYATKIDLMSQSMVYGSIQVTSALVSSDFQNSGQGCKQLALFALNKELIVIKDTERRSYWLRDVRNNTNFVLAEYVSMPAPLGASSTANIRPYFCLKGA